MKTVQDMLDRVTAAVQFVFIFSLASGLVVLYAALAATRDERALETALWRVLGARRGQLWVAQVTEFAAIGLLAGLLAAAGASAIGWALSSEVFNLPYHFNPMLWLAAMGLGSAGVALAGVAGLWGISREAPLADACAQRPRCGFIQTLFLMARCTSRSVSRSLHSGVCRAVSCPWPSRFPA